MEKDGKGRERKQDRKEIAREEPEGRKSIFNLVPQNRDKIRLY